MVESSDSDADELNWSLKKRKQLNTNHHETEKEINFGENKNNNISITEKNEKFEELKKKSEHIRTISAQRLKISEKRKTKRLIKKALRDPFVKELVDKEQNNSESKEPVAEKEEKEWKGIKPYLTINSHLQGPVSHGEWGPKNEVESLIDDAINEGDFEKAELLSDTLANREFAGKICKAYAAKRRHENNKELEAIAKAQRIKKIRWTFDAKPRWELKGHM